MNAKTPGPNYIEPGVFYTKLLLVFGNFLDFQGFRLQFLP